MSREEHADGAVEVRLYAGLRQVFGTKQVHVPAAQAPDVRRLLAVICDSPERRRALFAESGELRKEIVVLVNGRNIRFLDGVASRLAESDAVAVFPPVYGG